MLPIPGLSGFSAAACIAGPAAMVTAELAAAIQQVVSGSIGERRKANAESVRRSSTILAEYAQQRALETLSKEEEAEKAAANGGGGGAEAKDEASAKTTGDSPMDLTGTGDKGMGEEATSSDEEADDMKYVNPKMLTKKQLASPEKEGGSRLGKVRTTRGATKE